jgi:beta-lactamase regulating signal transducer with metallopeptidase domain
MISENLINAIGWTIIHSLWQGAAAALGLAVVMFFLRRSGARTRYLVGVMALMLILVMSMVTFVSIYQPGIQGIPVTAENGTQLLLTDSTTNQGNVTLAAFFKNYFNRHLPLVVTVWLLGVLVLVLRLSGGYLYNQRLKLHRNQPLPDFWQNRLETFCRQSGIGKPISLVESALVKIPMTIGHFKPMILFPLGVVTGLPRDQVEALLAHELAHILRKDYLVNILQSFVDIMFFYHPGVRWISSFIRSQRENCCDDIAVSLSGNSLNVAKALTNIQGYDMRTPYPAMAAAGKRWSSRGLLARVKRLVSPPVKGSGFAAGTIGAVVLVVGLLTLMVSTNAAAALSRDMVNEKSPALESVQPVDEEKDKEKMLQKKEQEKLTKLESKLKAEKMELEKKLQELVNKEEEARRQNKELDTEKKETIKILEKKLQEKEFKLQQLDTLIREQKSRIREQERVIRKEFRKQEREMRKQEEKMRVEEAEMRKQEALMRKQEVKMRVQETEMRKQEAKMREQEAQMRKQEAKMRAKEVEMREIEAEMQKQMDLFMEVLANELIRDKLISDIDDYEFQFKNKKLYINGEKQPDAVYKKYKKLYEKATGKNLDDNRNFRIVNRK